MKKVKIKNKKKFIFLLIILLLILLVIIVNKNKIKDILFPIYKIEDRTSNVEKYKKKYKKFDIYGWIRVQGTNIDYPILKEGERAFPESYGWINREYNEKEKKLMNYMPIFGHNLANVSTQPVVGDNSMTRFEQLMSFVYTDFADKNRYIELTIDGKNYLYQIYAVSVVKNNDIRYYPENMKKKEKKKYINQALKQSYYKYDVDVNENDNLITLYTCTRMLKTTYSDIKVDGKLVKSSNKGYNYGMHEKESYKEIEKILKGDGEDV